MSNESYLLSRLPAELRLKIYEHVLAFERPLKLRQVVAGSKNTGILRANRQIHREALPVLYEINTIIVTRNDFCQDTDPDLQTPLRRDQVRHLLVRNFSQSIRCSSFSGGNNMYLEGCCDVCRPSATGFLSALAALPRIKTVVIDYHHHQREFRFIRDTIRGIGSTSVDAPCGFDLTCTDIARYSLTSTSFPPELSMTFTDLPFHTIWNEFARRATMFGHGVEREESLLKRLREDVHRELPDKIHYLHYAHHAVNFHQVDPNFCLVSGPLWDRWDDVMNIYGEGPNTDRAMEALTEAVCQFCDATSVQDATTGRTIMMQLEAQNEGSNN